MRDAERGMQNAGNWWWPPGTCATVTTATDGTAAETKKKKRKKEKTLASRFSPLILFAVGSLFDETLSASPARG